MRDVDSIPSVAGKRIAPELRRAMCAIQSEIPLDTGGGASLTKVLVLGDLIVEHGLDTIVELGVYRGRLLLAVGRLLAGLGRGVAIGVDPYDAEAAIQTDEHQRGVDLRAWAFQQDWDGLHQSVVDAIVRAGLSDHIRVLRQRSQEAASQFRHGSIDLVHIDGNHDASAVAEDLRSYLPLVRRGGFLVLDDASWPSVSEHCRRLASSQRLSFSLFDRDVTVDGLGGNDFAVFQIVNEPAEIP